MKIVSLYYRRHAKYSRTEDHCWGLCHELVRTLERRNGLAHVITGTPGRFVESGHAPLHITSSMRTLQAHHS